MTISTVAVCCDDLGLMADARRLCATAGVDAEVADCREARRWWAAAAVVLVDAVAAAQLADLGLSRRGRVVVLSRTDDPDVWRVGVMLGAERVAVLPADEPAIVQSIVSGRTRRTGPPVVACLPATGGAGASTVAAGIALAAARIGIETLLVDADAAGGGLDLLFGLEHAPGLRWTDIRAMSRDIHWGSVMDELVRPSPGLRLLSWGRSDDGDDPGPGGWPAPGTLPELGLVVLDLPRPAAADSLFTVDVTLLVTRAGVRQTIAAVRMAGRLRSTVDDVRVVVRGASRNGLSAADIAAAVGAPLIAQFAEDRRLPVAADDGQLARVLNRLPFDDLVRTLTADLGRAS